MLISCDSPLSPSHNELSLDAYEQLKDPTLTVHPQALREKIAVNFSGDTELDHFLHHYYTSGKPLVWIGRDGLTSGIDTLLSHIRAVGEIGLDKERFNYSQIVKDLDALKNYGKDSHQSLDELIARVESNLSKTYLRYTAGQRFGFVNPSYVFNYRETTGEKGKKMVYDHKFELAVERPDSIYYQQALEQVDADHAASFISASMPTDPLYLQLKQKLNQSQKGDTTSRVKYLANMERLRWKLKDDPAKHDKYVLVNIPSFRLYGVGGDTVLSMKIVCGAVGTKSPLMNSKIKRIELNPQWVMPHSIAKSLAHAGPGYFSRRNMYFVDRSGRRLSYASPEMRRKGLVSIVQRSGGGNSLGRIIFRFDNPFSVYLHHTNTPWAFSASNRAMSHGCIRLERPLDLARFVHGGDEKLQEKIAYSFSCDLSHPDSSMMVKNVPVSPEVPVYLVYYTIFAVPGTNEVVELNDIYGYDKLLVKSLSSLVSPSMRNSMKDKPQTNTAEKKETKSQPTVVKPEEKKEPKVEKQETPRPAPQEEQKSSDNKSNNAATERDGGSQTAI